MRKVTKEYNVYKFNELSDEAKEKALEKLYDLNVDYEWWESTYEDAKNIGLEITSFDLDRNRHAKGHLTESLHDVILAIIRDHGKDCDTFKLAKEYEAKFVFNEDNELENEDDLIDDFTHDLLEEYSIILQHEYEYQTSEQAIIETIEANDYDFDEDGNLF